MDVWSSRQPVWPYCAELVWFTALKQVIPLLTDQSELVERWIIARRPSGEFKLGQEYLKKSLQVYLC